MAALSTTDYGSLTDALHQRAAEAGIPLNGAFELTSRCNLACRMCYIRREAGDAAARANELSVRQWLTLAEQAAEAGMLFLLLTGGEIFLRPDFLEIYEPLTGLGLNLTLYSNGTLVSPKIAKKLEQRPPNRVEITLYGASPETYSLVTGQADGLARALRGLDLLREAGLTVTVKFTLLRSNLHEYEAVRELAHARGLPLKAGWLLTSRVDGAPNAVFQERLEVEQAVGLEEADEKARASWRNLDVTATEAACAEPMYCLAGKASFTVNPAGEMNVCMDLPMPGARPLETGFPAAWKQVRAFVSEVPGSPECAACDLRAWCPTCPGRAFVETRALTGIDSYSCEIARARQVRFAQVSY